MSQEPGGDNRMRIVLVAAVGLAWVATLAQVLRAEVLSRRDSADVRALVESARLTREHASARWIVRAGDTVLGTLSSVVSGSREEEQLAYVVEGEMHSPVAVRLKAIVVASWDRKPQRLVADVDVAGARHRLDGALLPDGTTLRVRWIPAGTRPEDATTWDLDDVPPLGPGPLPLPAPALDELARARRGRTATASGESIDWSLQPRDAQALAIGGSIRRARRVDLLVRGVTLSAWLDDSGLPLRIELPGGVVAEIAEDSR